MDKKEVFVIRTKSGNKVVRWSEIIEEAERQERNGSGNLYKTDRNGHPTGNGGFLIWSTMDGCAVAFRNLSGAWYLMQGWQGDFIYM